MVFHKLPLTHLVINLGILQQAIAQTHKTNIHTKHLLKIHKKTIGHRCHQLSNEDISTIENSLRH